MLTITIHNRGEETIEHDHECLGQISAPMEDEAATHGATDALEAQENHQHIYGTIYALVNAEGKVAFTSECFLPQEMWENTIRGLCMLLKSLLISLDRAAEGDF